MKILSVERLAIPDVLAVRFQRFADERGYFTETFRRSDFDKTPGLEPLRGVPFLQANESFSKKGVVRGLHFQWNPYQGKLVRTVRGHMVDLALDIRKGSPTLGKVVARDMPRREGDAQGEWVWVPPGFAHGVVFLEDSTIEYFCSGEWSPGCEASISPLAGDLDWSLCDPAAAAAARGVLSGAPVVSTKDREGFDVARWLTDPRSENFIHGRLP
jgi:dTDP-4-dehydrorhamnose 3,5-epimerase